jgi:uncharacterized membrane protein
MEQANLVASRKDAVTPHAGSLWRRISHYRLTPRVIQSLYLCISVPTVLLICFLVPPMQSIDESRHFMRACQIAQGGFLSEIDPATGRGGGVLPAAVGDFVHQWMNGGWLQSNEMLRTIPARLHALELASQTQKPISKTTFLEFPSAGIYSPSLYVPQSAGIALARLLSDKVYIWFYSARICNALCAIFLVWLALRAAPRHALLLTLIAIVPMSLSQFGSVSSDAGIMSLTVLFVALCIRFRHEDNLAIRVGLIACLLLLVLGKPVHLPLGVLIMTAHKRLGWRRAASFSAIAIAIAVGCYVYWTYLVGPFLALAGETHGQNPGAQVRFIVSHPFSFLQVILATLKLNGIRLFKQLFGVFGWEVLSLPVWFYAAAFLSTAIISTIIFVNRKKVEPSDFILAGVAMFGLTAGVLLAAYVLWNPPESPTIIRLQGRYFLPALAVLALIVPSYFRLGRSSRIVLTATILAGLVLSAFSTLRILRHFYFPQSTLLGKNIHDLFELSSGQSCPASTESPFYSWFEWVVAGKVASSGQFHVIVATEDGTILSEADPALTGADFPYVLLPLSSRSRWRVHVWCSNYPEKAQFWLIRGKEACTFGPKIQLNQDLLPDA